MSKRNCWRTSTEIESIARCVEGGEKTAVRLVAGAGFECYDFSLFQMGRYDYEKRVMKITDHPLQGRNYLSFVREVDHIARECGITCNQTHAPYPVYCKEIRAQMEKAIECTAEVGAHICVIHPDNNLPAEENAEMFRELLAVAKPVGVKIATENMWKWNAERDEADFAACATPEDFLRHLDAVNDPDFVACVDVGHAEMRGLRTTAPEMIRVLGGKVAALHLHDNDLKRDLHEIPFSDSIDFRGIVRALLDVGYTGDLTLEADNFMKSRIGCDDAESVGMLAEAAARLQRMMREEA